MTIKKTLWALCLLATTALAGTPTYTYYSSISTATPSGLAFGNGNLFVANLNVGTISALDVSSGNSVTLTPAISGLNAPGGLVFSNGTLYAANAGGNTINSYTISQNNVTTNTPIDTGTNSTPVALAISGNTLYVANGNACTVKSYAINNPTQTSTVVSSGLNSPSGLAISGNTLYVGNNQGFGGIDAYVLSNDGTIATVAPFSPISTAQNFPYGLTVDSQGYLYVVNQGLNNNGSVLVYTADGTLITTIGGGSLGTGDYQFNAPEFAAISPDGNYLYVSDTNNNRVQIFSIIYPSTVSPALLMLVGQGTMDQGMFNALSSLPMTVNLTLPQATQLMHSVGNMSATMTQISSAVGAGMTFVSGVAGTVVSTGFNAPSSPQASNSSFTQVQRTKFKNLTQQLPMLQFQSLQSLVDPVAGPVSYAAAATPFEQPKMTLKPVFLSNDNHHIWIQPYGGLQRLDSYDQVTGYSLKTIGTAMGAGGKVTQNVMLGVLVGGAMNSYTQDHTSGDGSVDNYYAGLYGGYVMPASGFHVDGSVILGQSKYTGNRNLSALGLVAKNSHKGWDASGQIQTGYKISYGDFSVDPFASVGARYSYQNAYQETNANPFNLSISSATTKTATIELGSKFQQSMVVNETMVNPMISLSAYREQPLAKQSNATMNFTDGGNSFSVPVSNQVKTFAKVIVGCAAMFTNDISISTLVTGKIRKHEKSVEALVKVSYVF